MSSQQIIGKNYRNQVRQRSAWRDSPEFYQWFYFSTRQSEEQQKPVTSLMLTLKMTRQTEMNMQSNSMTSETTSFFWELGTPKPSHPSLSLSILPRSRTSSSSISITLCVLSVEVEHYRYWRLLTPFSVYVAKGTDDFSRARIFITYKLAYIHRQLSQLSVDHANRVPMTDLLNHARRNVTQYLHFLRG